MANLMNYNTGEIIRTATADETAASLAAAGRDGGVGAITVEIDGEATTCYVIGEDDAADDEPAACTWDAAWQTYTRLSRAYRNLPQIPFRTEAGRRGAAIRLRGNLQTAWDALAALDAGIAAACRPGLDALLTHGRV